MNTAVQKPNPKLRAVAVRMKRETEMSTRQIAEQLDVKLSTVWNCISQAGLCKPRGRPDEPNLVPAEPQYTYSQLWDRFLASERGSAEAQSWLQRIRIADRTDDVDFSEDDELDFPER